MTTFEIPHHSPDEITLDQSTGEVWRALRKILSPTFTSGKMKGMLEPIESIADRTINYISEQIKIKPNVDVKPIMQGLTLDVISKIGFGVDTNVLCEDSDFAKTAADIFNSFRANTWAGTIFFNIFSHLPFLLNYMPLWPESAFKIRQMTHDIIEDRIKNNIDIGDFIDRLKQVKKKKLEPPLTDGMLDAQGIIFLTAGYDTTANTLGSMVYELAKNPDVQDRLLEEISSICESSEKINHENIKDMHLLEAAIEETLRLRPAATEHDRVCTNDCEVNGIKIPKGTKIQMPNLASHYNAEFFPEPHLFKLERFLKENSDQIIEYTWRPFGGGNRVCIGQRFAIMEMKLFMAKFITRFKIIAIPETKMKYSKGDLFMRMYPDMTVQLEERK